METCTPPARDGVTVPTECPVSTGRSSTLFAEAEAPVDTVMQAVLDTSRNALRLTIWPPETKNSALLRGLRSELLGVVLFF